MKVAVVPKASTTAFKHGIKNDISYKDLRLSKKAVTASYLKKLLDSDTRALFGKCKSPVDLIAGNAFSHFNGTDKEFLKTLRGKKLNFLVVIYLGKMYNYLKADYRNPDLSNLIFLNRLDSFARTLGKLSDKKVSITVALENSLFDKTILRMKKSAFKQTVKVLRKFISDFGMVNVSVEPLEKFIGGKKYYDSFERNVSEINSKIGEFSASEDFSKVFNIFYFSFATDSFDSALKLYTSKPGVKKINGWATEAIVRYQAFHNAREETKFWDINRRFIRSSVSNRPGIVVFDYAVGRMSPLHGIATMYSGKVGTEFFYDLARTAMTRKSGLTRYYYKGMPMFTVVK